MDMVVPAHEHQVNALARPQSVLVRTEQVAVILKYWEGADKSQQTVVTVFALLAPIYDGCENRANDRNDKECQRH